MAQQRFDSAVQNARLRPLGLRKGPEVASISHRVIPVEGGRIRLRLYRPVGSGPFPLHVFLHGGGWCIGTLDDRDPRCQALAAGAGCLVVSVDYRMAPENQYPTPPEDCFRALTWLVAHAEELDVDASRVSVGGESAGANLAAVVALMARDRGGPALRFQLLDVPAVDLTLTQPSIEEFGTGYLLERRDMESFIDNYLPDRSLVTDPYVSPLFAEDLSGLPPAWITTMSHDPLQDDGKAYADRLREAGVEVWYRQLQGHIHSSFAFTRLSASARAYEESSVAALRKALSP
jgi:acetyl esterase